MFFNIIFFATSTYIDRGPKSTYFCDFKNLRFLRFLRKISKNSRILKKLEVNSNKFLLTKKTFKKPQKSQNLRNNFTQQDNTNTTF